MIYIISRNLKVAVEIISEMVTATCLKDREGADDSFLLWLGACEIIYALEVACVIFV